MKRYRCLLTVAGICLVAGTSAACRYTVRDIGFVDLGTDGCILFALVDNSTPPALVEELKTVVSNAFDETDLLAELVNTADDPAHPAVGLAAAAGATSRPAVLFVTPDGRCRTIELTLEAAALKSALAPALDALASSPLRRQIADACAARYGVVLIIDGPDAEENAAAKRAADAAAELIGRHMDYLPKPVAEGPVVMTLPREMFQREDLLLWCLNLAPAEILHPHVAIFYGRARQIGPVLTTDQVTENILANVLALIGADCECGLDRRWMQGRLLPAKWPARTRARLAESLGFDPDSPMVKMEVSMIVGKGPASSGLFDTASLDAVPYGYQEIDVQFDEPNAPAEPFVPPSVTGEEKAVAAPAAPQDATPLGADAARTFSLAVTLAVVSIFGAAAVVVGILILLRARLRT